MQGESMRLLFLRVVFVWFVLSSSTASAETFFTPTNATCKVFKGLSEASSPDPTSWRRAAFDNSAWTSATAPIFYLLEAKGTTTGTVLISEFMAANARTLLDENGAGSDWIELVNAGNETVSLEGWFLTDQSSNLVKWRLPATNLAANARLVVF